MKQTIQQKQVTGIILCGGKSKRMGKNKALLKLDGKYIISHVIDTLLPFCDEILISSNKEDLDFLGYPIVNDIYDNIGPISGIFSALLKSKNEVNILLSCDTPFINKHLLTESLSIINEFDVVLPEFDNFLQPMTGAFKKAIIPTIKREIMKGNYIPPRIFEKCNLNKLKISSSSACYDEHLFFNINSPEDYLKAQEMIKQNIN